MRADEFPHSWMAESWMEGDRLDKVVAVMLSSTRGQVQALMQDDGVLVNDVKVKDHYRLRAGDIITVLRTPDRPLEADVTAESTALTVRFEDRHVLVVDKPAGMVVHPAAGLRTGTLVNALLARRHDLSTIGGSSRPGIVHRLDKDTSGLIMVAKTNQAHVSLTEQLRDRTLSRRYLVLVHGDVKLDRGTIDAPIGRHPTQRTKLKAFRPQLIDKQYSSRHAREARTLYEVQERFGVVSYLHIKLETGRTHQIRVHMQFLGHPVVGDLTYGGRRELVKGIAIHRQALHAFQLGFRHPVSGRMVKVDSPIPKDIERVLNALRKQSKIVGQRSAQKKS